MINVTQAIQKINPDAKYKITGSNIDTCEIEWFDTTPISKEDIKVKMAELKIVYDAEGWKRNRKAEYPNHNDCIHALLDGGDTLTDLQAKRTATKNKYPKT